MIAYTYITTIGAFRTLVRGRIVHPWGRPAMETPGLYVIYADDDPLYIGKSIRCVYGRVRGHVHSDDAVAKMIDREWPVSAGWYVAIVTLESLGINRGAVDANTQLERCEAQLIKEMKPPLNVHHSNGSRKIAVITYERHPSPWATIRL